MVKKNLWLEHVHNEKIKHPELTYKQLLHEASLTYKKGGELKDLVPTSDNTIERIMAAIKDSGLYKFTEKYFQALGDRLVNA